MLVHHRATPNFGTHLNTWVERGTVRVMRLARAEHNTMSRPGLEPRPLDPETTALAMTPPHLAPSTTNPKNYLESLGISEQISRYLRAGFNCDFWKYYSTRGLRSQSTNLFCVEAVKILWQVQASEKLKCRVTLLNKDLRYSWMKNKMSYCGGFLY